ncbi:hypothetical protein EV213_1355 [Aureibacillus halotolerans]|uniref:Uncharacterized protein n=1 Tax=Aureibacillus halotolerans TaxID=1508390 RepID=A0A4R6TPE3_9BACI|nr:hypothetical protein EV213_1355 [Aureibacillus halotolerans]
MKEIKPLLKQYRRVFERCIVEKYSYRTDYEEYLIIVYLKFYSTNVSGYLVVQKSNLRPLSLDKALEIITSVALKGTDH